MPRHTRFASALIVVLGAAIAACSSPQASDPAAAGAGPGGGGRSGRGGRGGGGGAVPVLTTKVEQKAVPGDIPAVGIAEAMQTVQIRAQITGQLAAVHLSEGQEVRKGQLLFTIDPRPFETALQQAQAVLARDTATADNATAQRARYDDLFKRGLIPRDQYETQTATAASLQATLQADRASVETARLNLQYTRIAAPVAGRTGSLGVHAGDLVRANDTNPMVVINQMSPIYVTFAVPGRYLQDIHRYQAQKALIMQARGQPSVPPGAQPPPPSSGTPDESQEAEAGPVEEGKVSFIDNAVDATTGTIRLKGTFQNADRMLWPGLFVRVTLSLTTDPNAIVVPAAAVQSGQSGHYVYVVKDDRTVELRPVTVQRQQGEEMVIARGLTPGEEVVTDGQLRLTPGARVTQRGSGAGQGDENGGGGGRRGGGRRGGQQGAGPRGVQP